jgi:hypothetical protein
VSAPTQPPSPETAPASSTAGPDAIESAIPVMSFLEFWLAMGQTGREGYARPQWCKLSATDKGRSEIGWVDHGPGRPTCGPGNGSNPASNDLAPGDGARGCIFHQGGRWPHQGVER